MLATILELVMSFLKAIPIFNKWFTKTPEQKVEDAKAKLREEMDQFEKTGRPPQ